MFEYEFPSLGSTGCWSDLVYFNREHRFSNQIAQKLYDNLYTANWDVTNSFLHLLFFINFTVSLLFIAVFINFANQDFLWSIFQFLSFLKIVHAIFY